MRRRAFVIASAGIATTLAGCGGGDDAAGDGQNEDLPEEETISLTDEGFDPRIVQIATGGSVTWENETEESYRVNSFQFHSESQGWSFRESLDAGASVSHTFDTEGMYDFMEPEAGQFVMCGRVRVGSVGEGQDLPCE